MTIFKLHHVSDIMISWRIWSKFYVSEAIWYFICTSHYTDVIMGTIASQITSPTIVNTIVYSDADQRKHQSSASLAPVNSPHKWPVTRKMFPFDDVIIYIQLATVIVPCWLEKRVIDLAVRRFQCRLITRISHKTRLSGITRCDHE